MARIFGWSNAVGGVHHYRIREPLRGLALLGHQTRSSPVAVLENFEDYDAVIVRGLHHPQNSTVWRWAAESGKPALRVYDLDDDIWGWNPGSPEDNYWTNDRRENAEINIQAADLVTTPTDALAEVLRGLNPNVTVLPNTIPEAILRWLPPKHERFIIGWQGAQQHVKDLQLIYTPVLRFLLNHPDVEFHVWGPQDIMDFPDALTPRIIVHPWTPRVWDHYARLSMDIGLAPIDVGDRFNETKSDIRLREYAALGIPFIASKAPAYLPTTLAARGLVAETEEDWQDALEKLYRSPSLRTWMVEQGKHRARLWTTEANARDWERAYERASERKRSNGDGAGFSHGVYTTGDGNRYIKNVHTNDIL